MTTPTLPRTGPGKDTQVIFDRPELQARRHRWVYSTLTLVAWMLWMYLWLPVVTLAAWYLGARTFIREIVIPDPRTMATLALGYLIVVVILGVALVVWSRYNLRRFRGRERRHASHPVSDREMQEWFRISPEKMERLRWEGSLIIEHDDEGQVLAVVESGWEVRPAPAQVRDPEDYIPEAPETAGA